MTGDPNMAPKSKRLRKCTRILETSNDYMFQLPDAVLQHILFFLPIQDAARASTLSKTWFRVWKSLPVFSFSFDQHQLGMPMPKFVTLVNQSLSPLQNDKAIIQSFTLKISLSQDLDGFVSDIDNWVCLVLRNYVRELHISMSRSPSYILPEATFASKSLVKLRLHGCKLPATLFADAQEFNCLKELYLMEIVADEDQIQNLINCFPSLEKLYLKLQTSMSFLALDNFRMLQYVAVVAVKILRVNAPNLRRLCLAGTRQVHASDCTLNIQVLSCILSPRILNINSFPLLETLCLSLPNNRRFRIQHSHLKTLHLYGTFEAPTEVEIDAPKLYRFYCNGSIFPSLRVTSTSIKECETLELHVRGATILDGSRIHQLGILDGSRIHQLGNLLQNFNPSIEVNLHNLCTENFLTLAQLQEQEVISGLSNVRKLVLTSVSASSDYTSILDGLLWTCHPSTLLIKECSVNSDNFIKFLFRELLDREGNPTCCRDNLLPKCWRHFLKGVEVQYYMRLWKPAKPVRVQSSNLSHLLSMCDTGKEIEFIFEWVKDPVCSNFQDF